ncbi:MAG: hypothetical protein EPO35_05475 [Acidobacteria bacterium]|nr:MAG: hypothetical protein EPO35_05475 [Acidobacteriota bacterium]
MKTPSALVAVAVVSLSAAVLAQGTGAPQGAIQFGGTNPDGSLRPARAVTRLFSQDAYTQYEILEPGSEAFRITFLPEVGPGATELTNATRSGSEGGEIEVYDPRTGEPLKFTYEAQANGDHMIRAQLPMKVPEGGIGRVLIYKTYKDARTYMMNGKDIVWVRSLSGYRLGVVLPKGFSLLSSDVAAQMSTLPDGRVKLAFANPSGQSNPVTIHARPTDVKYTPSPYTDMFFDDIKTLYDLGDPATGTFSVEQTYSDYRKGASASIDAMNYLALRDLRVVDLDTAKPLATKTVAGKTTAALEVPIKNEKQSAHLKVTGTVNDKSYGLVNGEIVFTRTIKGLRNTVLLPAGYQVTGSSQSGTVGQTREGRAFVALINLNAENSYNVTIRARK